MERQREQRLCAKFKVVLFTGDDAAAEVAYETDDFDEAVGWAEEWLRDPMGCNVGILAQSQ
jgi:hypothetical protein